MGSINFNDAISKIPCIAPISFRQSNPCQTDQGTDIVRVVIPKRGIEKFGAVDLSHFKKRVGAGKEGFGLP